MARKTNPYLDAVAAGPSPRTSHPDDVAVAPEWCWDDSDERAPFGSDDGHDTLRRLEGSPALRTATRRSGCRAR